jgi:hypothetical protein
MILLGVLGLVGLGISFFLPANPLPSEDAHVAAEPAAARALPGAA